MPLIRLHDPSHHRMPDDVGLGEALEGDALDSLKRVLGFLEA
jgi:hypothetical protein